MTRLEAPIEFGPTRRGALVGKFTDRFGAQCSLQESSYVEEPCVWVGVEIDSMGELVPNARMHLTRPLARQLAEALLHFASEGTLGIYDEGEYEVGKWVVGVARENRGMRGRVVEARPGTLIKVQDCDAQGLWECSWSRVPSTWLPSDPPPRVSLFERLEGAEV